MSPPPSQHSRHPGGHAGGHPGGHAGGDGVDLSPGPDTIDAITSGIETKQLGGKLAGLSLPRQVLVLAFWPLLEQFLQFLVGTVDLALAGHLEPEPLKLTATSALGVTSYVMWLMAIIHSSVGVGAAALIARAIGGRHRRLANAALGQALLLAVAGGAVTAAAIFAAARWIGMTAGLEGQSLQLATIYLRIVGPAGAFSAMLIAGNAAMRAAGDTRTPFVIMTIVNVVNIIASVTFVYAPAPLGGHGVAGIAAGTFVAWCVGSVISLIVLTRGWGGIHLRLIRLRPHLHTMKRVIRVGAPHLLEGVLAMWLGNYLVLMVVGRLAVGHSVGAHMIAVRVESLSFLAGFALMTAAATLTGQYLGLGDPRRARQAVLLCWAFAAAIMGPMGIVFIFAPRALANIMTDSPQLLDLCTRPIQICGPIQIFFAMAMVFSGALRGAGDTRTTMWMTAASILLVRVPAVYLVGSVLNMGLSAVWVVLCGELTFRGLLFAARFAHGGWTKVKV